MAKGANISGNTFAPIAVIASRTGISTPIPINENKTGARTATAALLTIE